MDFSIDWWGRKHLKQPLDPDCFICNSSKRVSHAKRGQEEDKKMEEL